MRAIKNFTRQISHHFSNSLQKCINNLPRSDVNNGEEIATFLKRRTTQKIEEVSSAAPIVSTEESITRTEEPISTTEKNIESTAGEANTTEGQESSSDLPVSVTESTEQSTEEVTGVTTEENISSDASTLIPESTEDVTSSTDEEESSTTDITISTEETTEDDSSSIPSDSTTESQDLSTLDSSVSTDGEISSSTLDTESSSVSSSENSISTTEPANASSTSSASSEIVSDSTEIASDSPTTEETTSPEPEAFKCFMAGFFPEESKCNEFYSCQYNADGGLVPFKMTCPKGLYFNPYKQYCVDEARCDGSNFLKATDKFRCFSEGRFAHEKDCSLYFNCSLNEDKNTFLVSIKRCRPGHFFNLSTRTCSHRSVFSCLWRRVSY